MAAAGRTTTAYRSERRAGRMNYLEGNAARQLEYAYEAEKLPRNNRVSSEVRRNREKHSYMNVAYVLFLIGAILVLGYVMFQFVELRSSVTNHTKTIARMEAEYNNLKRDNDETLARINGSIDLEQVKAIAIGQLGMSYAEQGQIVNVEKNETDYVRQTMDFAD